MTDARICHTFLKHHLKRPVGKGHGLLVRDDDLAEMNPHINETVEICGRPLEVLVETIDDNKHVEWWFCPSCDRRDAPELQTGDEPVTV